MKAIFLKTLKEKYLFILIITLMMIATLWLYISMYPTISKSTIDYEALLSQFPKETWKIFGLDNGSLLISTFEQYILGKMLSLVWPIMAIIVFVNMGNQLIGKEIDRKTITILLSLPVTRSKMFLSKYFAGLILIVIFTMLSIFPILPIANIYDINPNEEIFSKFFASSLLFLLSGYGLCLLFSTIFDHGKAIAISIGIYVLMYIVNVLSGLSESLDKLKYLSLFHYMDFSNILAQNQLNIKYMLVMFILALVLPIISIYIFSKKDITV